MFTSSLDLRGFPVGPLARDPFSGCSRAAADIFHGAKPEAPL
jgi:hypothetical protein